MATEGPLASSAADFACARQQAFPPSEENSFRHLRIADFSDSVAALPPEELQVPLPLQAPESCHTPGVNALAHSCADVTKRVATGAPPVEGTDGQSILAPARPGLCGCQW